MREICAAVYGLVMSRSNSMEPLQKAIWVTFCVAISVFDAANSQSVIRQKRPHDRE